MRPRNVRDDFSGRRGAKTIALRAGTRTTSHAGQGDNGRGAAESGGRRERLARRPVVGVKSLVSRRQLDHS